MADTSPGTSTGVAGVGATAFLVAAARAIETSRPDAPAQDAYAEHFVRAAPGCAGWPRRFDEVPDGDADPLWGRLARFFGLRTRFFDDFLLSAAAGGCRQVVVLGAGLDSRAFRLPWPEGSAVFEIDQEEVLAFKRSVLDTMGAVPRAARFALAADLREDWTSALIAAGFDPTRPTAWLAEGLLPYLPPAAEHELLAAIDAHSAPGSALGYEAKHGVNPAGQRHYPVYAAALERLGMDLLTLFDAEPRPHSVADLTARGWTTAVHDPFDVAGHLGITLRPTQDDALVGNQLIIAGRSPAAQSTP